MECGRQSLGLPQPGRDKWGGAGWNCRTQLGCEIPKTSKTTAEARSCLQARALPYIAAHSTGPCDSCQEPPKIQRKDSPRNISILLAPSRRCFSPLCSQILKSGLASSTESFLEKGASQARPRAGKSSELCRLLCKTWRVWLSLPLHPPPRKPEVETRGCSLMREG